MSHRPIEEKKRRRVAKAFKRKRLATYFDLVDYLTDRRIAKTRRDARAMLLAGKVMVESHPVGYVEHDGRRYLAPVVPTAHRERLMVAK